MRVLAQGVLKDSGGGRANLFASAARVASARFFAHCLASSEAFKPAGLEEAMSSLVKQQASSERWGENSGRFFC